MGRLEFADREVERMFAAFGLASYRAQQFETLLISTLQYSLAVGRKFSSLEELGRTGQKHSTMPMGQVLERLRPFLDDEALDRQILTSIYDRNTLAHHYFRSRQAGDVMTPDEMAESIEWCRSASKRFKAVALKLRAMRDERLQKFGEDPDSYVPNFWRDSEALPGM